MASVSETCGRTTRRFWAKIIFMTVSRILINQKCVNDAVAELENPTDTRWRSRSWSDTGCGSVRLLPLDISLPRRYHAVHKRAENSPLRRLQGLP